MSSAEPHAPESHQPGLSGSGEIRLFLAGDALITRPWSHVRSAAFLELLEEIRAADVAITNLETVIHEFRGYAQADCGGVHLASPPAVARELKWAGFHMVAHANNHTFDYGSTGVLETIEHVEAAGLAITGSGRDLQRARKPVFTRCDSGVVALVAAASHFIPYGKASYSRQDLHGRPGLNPLSLIGKRRGLMLPNEAKKRLRYLRRLGIRLHTSDHYGLATGVRVDPGDLEANLAAISDAAARADIVVASVHDHDQAEWLTRYARRAIEAGASVVFIHGPHKIKGIELFQGRPIFYSMGDFVYETDYISRFPAESYLARQLPHDTELDETTHSLLQVASLNKRPTFEGFAASLTFERKRLSRLRLVPVDLQFDGGPHARGRPQLADPELGRDIIARIAAASKRYGTPIAYDEDRNRGEVLLPRESRHAGR